MKRFVCVFGLLALIGFFQSADTVYAAGKPYKGCGSTIELAREALASNILIRVQTEISREESLATEADERRSLFQKFLPGGGRTEFRSEQRVQSIQSVNMVLVNVKVMETADTAKEGDVCLIVYHDDIVGYANEMAEKTKHYIPSNLPGHPMEKSTMLNAWLADIETTKHLSTAFSRDMKEKAPHKRLIRQEKELNDLSRQFFGQSLVIHSTLANSELLLNGQPAMLGEELFLPTGKHSYSVKAPIHCEVAESVRLEPGQAKTLRVTPEPFPRITFSCNQPDAKLTVSGSRWTLGREKIIDQCEGDLNYIVAYRKESTTGSIRLRPGLQITERVSLYTDEDINRLKGMAEAFTLDSSVEVGYTLSIAGSDEDMNNIHKVVVAYFKNYPFIRYGGAAAYGRSTSSTPSETIGAWASLYFQLSEIGSRSRPLHIKGILPIIPFAGIDAGLGYIDSNDFEKDEKFIRDHGIFRITGGGQVPVNRHVGIRCFYSKNFFMEKASGIGTVLSVRF